MMRDVTDLRDANWVQKSFRAKASTLDDLREDVECEELLKHNGEAGILTVLAGGRPDSIAGVKVNWGGESTPKPIQNISVATTITSDRRGVIVSLPLGGVRKILGPGCATVQALQEETGARVWVDSKNLEAVIKGSDEAVAAAKRGIQFLIENLPDEMPKPPTQSGRFKTILCKYFARGECLKGKDCTFRHELDPQDSGDEDEETSVAKPHQVSSGTSRFRTVPCKYFSQGSCSKGKDCTFLHETVEGGEQQQAPRAPGAPQTVTPSSRCFRTVPCKYFSQGSCHKGSECTFLHEGVQQGSSNSEKQQHQDNNWRAPRQGQTSSFPMKQQLHRGRLGEPTSDDDTHAPSSRAYGDDASSERSSRLDAAFASRALPQKKVDYAAERSKAIFTVGDDSDEDCAAPPAQHPAPRPVLASGRR
jgi:E3 ubiquitin-protein ligase makorin